MFSAVVSGVKRRAQREREATASQRALDAVGGGATPSTSMSQRRHSVWFVPLRPNYYPPAPTLEESYGPAGAAAIERLARASALASMLALGPKRPVLRPVPLAGISEKGTAALHGQMTLLLRQASVQVREIPTSYDVGDPLAMNLRTAILDANQADVPWLAMVQAVVTGHNATVSALHHTSGGKPRPGTVERAMTPE